ncbi:MAG: pyridoxal phosphate-dependent aminotransferase, partial [Deltaproteobacteria bacterium]|nr:pyridoxal phosphate-dependent aminotransferase [Deltaproteobacteria bacterium]
TYGDPRGLLQLRETFARSISSRVKFMYSADSVLVGAGAKAILFLLFASFGKRILLPRGSWVSYKPQAEMCGKEIGWIPVDQKTGKIKDLSLTEGDILILNSPSNPWGCVYDDDELENIAEEVYRANAFVISDEIYWPITHLGTKASSFASFCPDRTIVIDGLSKWAGAAGWRLGIAAFGKHPELKKAYLRCVSLSSQIFSCVCLPCSKI